MTLFTPTDSVITGATISIGSADNFIVSSGGSDPLVKNPFVTNVETQIKVDRFKQIPPQLYFKFIKSKLKKSQQLKLESDVKAIKAEQI